MSRSTHALESARTSSSSSPNDRSADNAQLSAYERRRNANIRRNKAMMEELGLSTTAREQRRAQEEARAAAAAAARAKEQARAKRKRGERSEPVRRSARKRGTKPDYTGEFIDRMMDEPDPEQDARKRAIHKAKAKKATFDELVAQTDKWLEQSREELIARVEAGPKVQKARSNKFEHEAVRRWGSAVTLAAKSAQNWDWEKYVLTRMSTVPPPAPAEVSLMQEDFGHCPWRLLVSCVLMSRVSSAPVKEKAINGFFSRYPTPSAALEAKSQDALAILAPLGLFPNRMRAVIDITKQFLQRERFEVGLQPEVKIYGVGSFGVDSYHIFCRDQGASMRPDDRNLAAFCRWRAGVAKKKKEIDE